MRLALRLSAAGWGLEVDFGRTEEEEPQEHVVLSGGPIGFALPEPEIEEYDEEDEECP
ncbi:hypothetical protein [Micromonospora sp. CB01531]|uniref:hypothetical protein n=1 Tax=Micromonospora sp. CB01531 TaxID=1718947 RepID=UPI000A829429|nr:hypothetical protein [Micromonospora sp. CB01531]